MFSFVMCILGALLVIALRSGQGVLAFPLGDRQGELIEVVMALEQTKEELGIQATRLRLELANQEAGVAEREGLRAAYRSQLGELEMRAGVVSVSGPGLRVKLSDNPHPPDSQGDPVNYIIHDYDLRVLVNALWNGGAEAIAVNGQRLTQFSSIRCVGTMVLVNSNRLAPPFIIEALGEAERLRRALEEDGDSRLFVCEYARRFGLGVAIDVRTDLTLPAYDGRLASGELERAEAYE